ncbi:hypothetical protein MIND_01376000 [Mycena indigotica]|uniref:Uncharacterized protein n=1 Tax=Mycena indigotica TaxID=2126181 RepID=A0A8H6S0P9_9AGAR|nr:uncharacterized protein MIND_01376000 [Mycena indigotica]KAF7289150.1 hypothetical protein MIND_01376000 [Mycena indigotica]
MLFLLAFTSTYARSNHSECNDINDCRRLFDIVWGCLVTIFLCIWVSVHPNIPPPCPEPPDGTGLRFLKWWLVDGNRPFLQRLKLMTVALIAPEFILGFAARQLQMARFLSQAQGYGLSLTHGFFIVMGGFVDGDGHPVVTQRQLRRNGVTEEIRAVHKSDIEDKSKGDLLSKGIALCQGLWFMAQCIARRAQHLPLTELEVATLAFTTISAITWILWLQKPLDVRGPLKLLVKTKSRSHHVGNPYPAGLTRIERFGFLFSNSYNRHEYDPFANTSVPAFWGLAESDFDKLPRWSSFSTIFAQFACAILIGGIHLTAWGAFFPSIVEMWLWRSSALMLTVLPIVFIVLSIPGGRWATHLRLVIIGIYSIARGIVLVLSLATLRLLPPAAFTDINWSIYVPHF